MRKIIFVENKQKYLFCADKKGIKLLSEGMELATKKEIFIFEEDRDWSAFIELLNQQKMGSYLYISLPENELRKAREIVAEAGFDDDNAQLIGYGKKEINVFCCRCHALNPSEKSNGEMLCSHCGLELSISDHYSKKHDAFLGYVAKL